MGDWISEFTLEEPSCQTAASEADSNSLPWNSVTVDTFLVRQAKICKGMLA